MLDDTDPGVDFDECVIDKILAKKGSLYQAQFIYTLAGETVCSETDWVDRETLEQSEEGLQALVKWTQKSLKTPAKKIQQIPKAKKTTKKPELTEEEIQEAAEKEAAALKALKAEIDDIHRYSFRLPIEPKTKKILDALDLSISIFEYCISILGYPLFRGCDIHTLSFLEMIGYTIGEDLRSWVLIYQHYPKHFFAKIVATVKGSLDINRVTAAYTLKSHLKYLKPRVPYYITVPPLLEKYDPTKKLLPRPTPAPMPSLPAQVAATAEGASSSSIAPAKVPLNLDVAGLIFTYLETPVLHSICSVSRGWCSFLKPIILQRPTQCIYCFKHFSVYDTSQYCRFHKGELEEDEEDDQFLYLFGGDDDPTTPRRKWTCCNGSESSPGCYTSTHNYTPSRIWSLTPSPDWYLIPLRVASVSGEYSKLCISSNCYFNHLIRENDLTQIRKLFGACRHVTQFNYSRIILTFDNEIIPRMWAKKFPGTTRVNEEGHLETLKLHLYYQLTQAETIILQTCDLETMPRYQPPDPTTVQNLSVVTSNTGRGITVVAKEADSSWFTKR